MAGKLEGKKVAIVVTDGFEQIELESPMKALQAEGASCEIVSPKGNRVRGWRHTEWGDSFEVHCPLDKAAADDFDALLLPGGVMNSDKLRGIPEVQRFVRSFFEAGKPVAAICHGPWTLIDAGVAQGRTLTSWPSLRSDLVNAGATWVDEPVVVDRGLVTSRKPADLDVFDAELIEQVAEGQHEARPPAGRAERPIAP